MNEIFIRKLEDGWIVIDKGESIAPWIMGKEYAAESVERVLELVEQLLRPVEIEQ